MDDIWSIVNNYLLVNELFNLSLTCVDRKLLLKQGSSPLRLELYTYYPIPNSKIKYIYNKSLKIIEIYSLDKIIRYQEIKNLEKPIYKYLNITEILEFIYLSLNKNIETSDRYVIFARTLRPDGIFSLVLQDYFKINDYISYDTLNGDIWTNEIWALYYSLRVYNKPNSPLYNIFELEGSPLNFKFLYSELLKKPLKLLISEYN
jgi:hypothetical protein